MTISTETRKAGPFNGNDVTVAFDFSFKVFIVADVVVTLTNSAGVESVLTGGGTDYSVSLNANQDTSPGGTVTKTSALATGEKLTITSGVQYLQPLDLSNQTGFYPSVLNGAFDRVTILIQQLAEEVDRAVKADVSSSVDPDDLIDTLIAKVAAASASATAAAASAIAAAASQVAAAASAASAAATLANAVVKDGSVVMTGSLQLGAGAGIVFEGTTDDAFETTLSGGDPTADRVATLPDYTGAVKLAARGADIASAATVNLTTATGDIVDVTGTTAITAITLADGLERSVRFTGVLTLTHGASLVLPGATNITTAAGDVAVFRGYAAGVVRCVSYTKADGTAVVASSGGFTFRTAVASTSGTTVDFTSIPAGVKQIEVMLRGVSTNGGSAVQLQIGDSGGIETSGYGGAATGVTDGSAATYSGSTISFVIGITAASADVLHGSIKIINITGNHWIARGTCWRSGTTNVAYFTSGAKQLSNTLDRVRITAGGTDTFDAGEINIAYG